MKRAAPGEALVDNHGRRINYLRLSVTDLCNLRCFYCMPRNGVEKLRHRDVLTLEECAEVARAAISLGVDKVRVTGGEPLVRRNLVTLLESIAAAPGLQTLALTTNGTLLPKMAAEIRRAGVHRVNISLDTLDPERFARITGTKRLADAVAGVDAALAAGLGVKLNAVLLPPADLEQIEQLIAFAGERDVAVRFIEQMTFDRDEPFVPEERVIELLAPRHEVRPSPADPRHPHVRRYTCDGVRVGFISPRSHSFCSGCNKLRLTPHGQLRACLASNLHVDVRAVLRGPHTADDLRRIIVQAARSKPAAGPWNTAGEMWRVGG